MIAVAGLNAAIDRLLVVDDLIPGRVLRAREAQAWPGGKGVHVALCAAVMGEDVRLAGPIDAASHRWFASWLRARGVEFQGVEISSPVRTCLTIRDDGGRTTEIREPGAAIEAGAWRAVIALFESICTGAAAAILSGSVPPGAPDSVYRDLVTRRSDVRMLVDAGGDLLRLAIEAAPFCIKPNREEAEALTGSTLDSIASAAGVARALTSTGVQLAIISMEAAGAIACWGNRVCHIEPPRVPLLNAVGAGDCLMGGVASGFARGDAIEDVLRLGVACGTAKLLSPEIGIVRREHIQKILPATRLRWLD
jgi:1-phosphofructokinase family hexose kinase